MQYKYINNLSTLPSLKVKKIKTTRLQKIKKERVIAYIDGFNLYNGLKDGGFSYLKWLNLAALIQTLLKDNQELIEVKYFTTLVTRDVNKRLRQKEYIRALETQNQVKIIYGKFQNEKTNCNHCGNEYTADCEKMTDVGIATHMIIDYYEDKCDMAMVISGDTDLLPPIKHINDAVNEKRAFVAFPPNRVNDEVRNAAKGSIVIGRKSLKESQFPISFNDKYGDKIVMPEKWAKKTI